MQPNRQEDLRRVAERASEWLETLAEDPSETERAAFAAWIGESPLHVREFLNMAAIDRQLGFVDPEHKMTIETARAKRSNVVSMQRSPETMARGRTWRWAAALAVLAVGFTALAFWRGHTGWQEYHTAIGEQNTIELADGTAVSLNTQSRLEVKFTPEARELKLIEGEALFKVHHDPKLPFRVRAGDSVIQAIGTEFNVYQRHRDTRVAVIEGAVRVNSVTLAAGEEARVTPATHIEKHRSPDPKAVTAWRERRLVFHRATLAEIAEEFNRYNERPQIRVEDPELRERRYTVVLPANDPQSLIDYLKEDGQVESSSGPMGVRISRK